MSRLDDVNCRHGLPILKPCIRCHQEAEERICMSKKCPLPDIKDDSTKILILKYVSLVLFDCQQKKIKLNKQEICEVVHAKTTHMNITMLEIQSAMEMKLEDFV